MARVEIKGYIPRTSRILWTGYAVYLLFLFTSMTFHPGATIGVALVVFAFALYDAKKIREYCRSNNVEFPRKLWVFAALTLIFTIATLPIYMYVRKKAIKQIASNIKIRSAERYD
jgi:uncharacterized membrane protein